MLRFGLLIAVLATAFGYTGEQELRKPGRNPYPLWAAVDNDYQKGFDYNKWLYMLHKKAVDIYGNTALSDDKKAKEIGDLVVPGDKAILKVTTSKFTEKEIYGSKIYVIDTVIDYGETGVPPVKCFIYTVHNPEEFYKHKTQPVEIPCIIAKISRSASKIAPALTLRCVSQETAEWLAVNCAYIK